MTLASRFPKWTLPAEQDFGWKMKSLETAKTSFTIEENGVFKLTIEHDPIRGVTPKMLLWWFKNIGGEMTYKGKNYLKYLVWHPKDHIHWCLVGKTSNNEVAAGSYFRIVEAFGRKMEFLVDSTEYVEKLDETGIRLVKRVGKFEIFSLQHDFIQDGQNTIYKSQMIVGINKKNPFNKIFNYCIRPLFFTKEMGTAWLKHNIEEVGNFEFFLPELYEKETKLKTTGI
ncbi:hypothetical protein ABTW24_19475 [Sphingobacterium thalpophilum]|uniref:DAPG hydrolase PhiG domain-containing protein n=1 Tax=Sphingobacterium thalpophilum TaxID=259 RepID=A0ABV4HJW6_9SPHI